MGLQLGSTKIKSAYLGATQLARVYFGTSKIWPTYAGAPFVAIGGFQMFGTNAAPNIQYLGEELSGSNGNFTGSGMLYNTALSTYITSDNETWISGYLDNCQGVTIAGIVKLNNSGAIDTTFDTTYAAGPGAPTFTNLGVTGDGVVLLADGTMDSWDGQSTYTNVNGTQYFNNIIKLDNTGQVDTTFSPGFGLSLNNYAPLQPITIQSDGKILIGAYFQFGGNFEYNGSDYGTLIRLNADGTPDTSFYPMATPSYPTSFQGGTAVIKELSDGKIMVGGSFYQVYNQSYERLVRLNSDGTVDPTFNLSGSFNGSILDVIEEPSGGSYSYFVAGDFDFFDGNEIFGLARITSGGAVDISYSPTAYTSPIKKIIDLGTELLVQFYNETNPTFNGTSTSQIIRVSKYTSTPTITQTLSDEFDAEVKDIGKYNL